MDGEDVGIAWEGLEYMSNIGYQADVQHFEAGEYLTLRHDFADLVDEVESTNLHKS
jgi:hypothetical protein